MPVAKVRWGVILIGIGVLLLLNTTGTLELGVWGFFAKWWPVLLIAIGLEKVFSSIPWLRPLAWVSPLFIAGMFAFAIAYERHSSPRWNSWSWQFDEDTPSTEVYSWTETGSPAVQRIEVKLDLAAGRLTARGGAEAGTLLEGGVSYRGKKPHVESSEENGVLRVEASDSEISGRRGKSQWRLKLNDSLPVDMAVDGGAARMHLDMTAVKLQKLDLSVGAADIDVVLGSLWPSVDCKIDCAAGTVRVTVPKGAGVHLEREGVLSNFSSDGMDLTEKDGVLETPDFAAKPIQIHLRLESAISTLRLREAGSYSGESSI